MLDRPVSIGPARLSGDLVVAEGAIAVIVFAHGSGSRRFSPRNRYVAGVLQRAGFGTLLLDLLTAAEEQAEAMRFDIGLLTRRLIDATDWLRSEAATQDLAVGYFGASTGAAAALAAAVERASVVGAVVSRGGRPDLAESLSAVRAPTLLIVGGEDGPVIQLNELAFHALSCEKRMEIVPGATHLFEEEGALKRVSELARDWFRDHLSVPPHHVAS